MLLRVSGQLRCQNCLGRFAKTVVAECEISEMTSRRPLERRCQTKRDRCALIEAARDGCRRRLAVQLPDGSNKWDAGLSPFVRSSGQTATGTRQTTCGSTNDPAPASTNRRRRTDIVWPHCLERGRICDGPNAGPPVPSGVLLRLSTVLSSAR